MFISRYFWISNAYSYDYSMPIRQTARSKAWGSDHSFSRVVGANHARSMNLCLLSVLSCQVQVSATCRSLVQMSPTEFGVSEFVFETSTMRRPWTTIVVEPWKKKGLPSNNTILRKPINFDLLTTSKRTLWFIECIMQYQPEVERPNSYPDNATPVTTRVKIFLSVSEWIYGLVAKWKWIFP